MKILMTKPNYEEMALQIIKDNKDVEITDLELLDHILNLLEQNSFNDNIEFIRTSDNLKFDAKLMHRCRGTHGWDIR
jgi:hypothetical protein